MIVRSVLFGVLMLGAVMPGYLNAEIGPPFKSNQSPSEFLKAAEDQGVYVVVLHQAELAEEERLAMCTVDYRALTVDILSGPNLRSIKFCSSIRMPLLVGERYLLFVRLFEVPSDDFIGWVTYERVFPIYPLEGSNNGYYVEVPVPWVDFPEDFYTNRFSRSFTDSSGETHTTEYVKIDWQKLRRIYKESE